MVDQPVYHFRPRSAGFERATIQTIYRESDEGLIQEGRVLVLAEGDPDGRKKEVVALKTKDHDKAVKRAILKLRAFEEKCGIGSAPNQLDAATVAGLVFEDVMHRPDGITPREGIAMGLARHKRNQHPLLGDFPEAGPAFERVADIVEKMWKASAMRLPELKHQIGRKSLTLEEQGDEWKKTKPALAPKTIDLATGRPRPQAPTGANQVWSYDFVFDWCAKALSDSAQDSSSSA